MFVTFQTGISSRMLPLLIFAGLMSGCDFAVAAEENKKSTQTKSSPATASTNSLTQGYTIKPSEVVLPPDVPLGRYRRMIQPFPNWTLICDENLEKKQKVCNISQTIIDSMGVTAFSWSLAASEDGKPFLILRTPPGVGVGKPVRLVFADAAAPISASTGGCDEKLCVAYLPVGPRLRLNIAKGATAEVSYEVTAAAGPARVVSLRAPLDGLAAALAAI